MIILFLQDWEPRLAQPNLEVGIDEEVVAHELERPVVAWGRGPRRASTESTERRRFRTDFKHGARAKESATRRHQHGKQLPRYCPRAARGDTLARSCMVPPFLGSHTLSYMQGAQHTGVDERAKGVDEKGAWTLSGATQVSRCDLKLGKFPCFSGGRGACSCPPASSGGPRAASAPPGA